MRFTKTYAANYPGRVDPAPGQVFGPNQLGELFTAKSAVYDEAADKTRVEFGLIQVEPDGTVKSWG